MSSTGWETVGKKHLKANNVHVKSVNVKKKAIKEKEENLDNGVIKPSQTTFSAFLELELKKEEREKLRLEREKEKEKEREKQKQKQREKQKSADQTKNKVANGKNLINNIKEKEKENVIKKKKINNELPKDKKNIEKAAREIRVNDFKKAIESTMTHFPDSPLIWIKDIAYYINDKLQFEPEDPFFTNKPDDFPLCLLPNEIKKLMGQKFKGCSEAILQLFQDQCLQTIINNIVKLNAPTLGFRLVLQYLAIEFPEITIANFQKLIQYKNSYQNRQNVCLPILWIAAQAGHKSLETGLNIWIELMFPLINVKTYQKYVIDILDKLLRLHKNSEEVLSIPRFLLIFDFVYSHNGLPANLQKQLQSAYSKLKKLVIKSIPSSNNMQILFPHFLTRLVQSKDKLLKERNEELLVELTNCLSNDKQCFSVWRTSYSQHLIQSSILMKHILNNFDSLPSNFDKNLLKKTIQGFLLTNEDARSQKKPLQDGHVACDMHGEKLIGKMSGRKMPFKPFFMFFTFAFLMFLAYDTQTHGSFQKSLTHQFLKDSGALPVLDQAWQRIRFYYGQAYSWLAKNVPVYWEIVSTFCNPYLELFWKKFAEVSIYIWNSTEGIRTWINKTIPPILEKITDVYLPKVHSFLLQYASQIHAHLSVVFEFILKYALLLGNWIQTNVLTGSLAPENIQKTTIQLFEGIQSYFVIGYQWFNKQIMALIV